MIFKANSPSFFVLVAATAAALQTATATTILHHPDSNPKLKLFGGADAARVVNWNRAERLCKDHGRSLATPEEVCAFPDLQSLEAETWIPVRKPRERNSWVRVGDGVCCQEYKDVYNSTLQGREWTEPTWGANKHPLPFDANVLCASIPEVSPLPQNCASVYGDPHITSFDKAKYDVQGGGDFVLAQSLDSALDVQGRFVKTRKAVSVMRGFHAWTGLDDEPSVEANFIDDECQLEFFIGGEKVDLDQDYVLLGTQATKSTGVHLLKGNQNKRFYFPGSNVTVSYRAKKSKRHGCNFVFKLCVPDDMATNERFIGLLGTPTGNSTDEWMTRDGTMIEMPTAKEDLRFGSAFEYAQTHHCIRDEAENKFLVQKDYTCDTAYDNSLEKAVENASPEVKRLCGDDLECIIEGATFEEEEGAPDGMEDSMEAIIEERLQDGEEVMDVTDDSEFEAEQEAPTSMTAGSQCGSPSSHPTSSPTNSPTATEIIASPTSSPTQSPTGTPSATNPPAPDEPTFEDRTTTRAYTRGDPHFKTFGGELYDYHGECDLVLLHNPDFKKGLGMDIHIRTKIDKFWSSVESAVIKLGDKTMEIRADPKFKEWLWFDGQEASTDLVDGEWNRHEMSGILVRYKQTGPNTREAIIYLKGNKEVMIMKTFKSFLRIDVNWKGSDNYYNSVGLLGAHAHGGKRLGRDGTFIENVNAFGQEWQVRPEVDGSLFHSYEGAIVGKKCVMPPSYHEGNDLSSSSLRGRRLGASALDTEKAEKACNHLVDPEEKKACVYDVISTQDLSMASTW